MPADYHTRIPLNSLFAQLRAEGFEINTATILDVQKVLANLNEDDVADIHTLPSLLGPLICRNKEEQLKFYTICKKYFESVTCDLATAPPPVIKTRTRKIILLSVGLILIAATIVYFIVKNKHVPSSTIQVFNSNNNQDFIVNDTIMFKVSWSDSADNSRFNYEWVIGDSVYRQQSVQRVFVKAGSYKEKLSITHKNGKSFSGMEGEISINCEKKPSVDIEKEGSGIGGQKIYRSRITNPSKNSGQYSYLWNLNNKFVSGQKDYYSNISSDSPYTIQLIVQFDKGVHCSVDSLTTTITETPEIALALIGKNPLQISRKLNMQNLLWLIGGLFIIPSLASFGIYRQLLNKRKKEKEELERLKREQEAIRRHTGSEDEEKKYAGPYSIEFAPQDEKIFAETGISQLAETLRKRHSSDNYHLNVYKTIRQTIKSGGFPSLQFTPKTQPTDFLILLDNEFPDGHLTHLFSWLIGKLKKEEVQFNAYSFYKEPLLLNNQSLSHHLLPLDKIARLYPESIVLIFSGANGFFDSYHPQVKNWIKQKFRNWETKLIITPVTKNDWGSKELALYDAGFTVVPADINAHQVITDEINFMIDKQKLKKTIVPGAYAARQHNFNRWNQLENYLGKASSEIQKLNNSFPGTAILQKWVCALAVYPHINWNITLAIGKAIEEKYCKPGQLVNYTNLLVLSRIAWLNDGQVSDALKKQMLVHLDKESEAVARSAVAKALSEIEPSINTDSLVNDEFIYLKTTNRFLLHTYDEKENNLTQQEHLRMRDYVEGNQLDWVLDEYLSTASNKSLLQQPGTTTSITPGEYFGLYSDRDDAFKKQENAWKAEQERLRKLKEKRQKWMDRLKVAASFLGVFILSFFILKQQNVFTGLYATQVSPIRFTLEPNPHYASLNAFTIELTADSNYKATVLSDTSAVIDKITLNKLPATAFLNIRNGNTGFQQVVDTIYSSYSISFRGKATMPRLLIRYNKATTAVNNALQSLSAYYNISALQQDETDSTRIIYYNPETKSRADSVSIFVQQNLAIRVPIIYIPENRTPPAPPLLFLKISDTAIGTTGNTADSPIVSCTSIAINALPATLTEIWSGSTNSRFIRIDIARKRIFYSTGNKNTYGLYTIEKICKTDNIYKLILKGDKTYRTFFLRNIQTSSFQLSVCQQESKTIEEAEATNNCDPFNRMTLYYKTDPYVIFVPVNTTSYINSELNKMNNIPDTGSKRRLLIMVNAQDVDAIRSNRYALIQKNSFLDKSGNTIWQHGEFNGTPFDRDYISHEGSGKTETGLNCNVVYYSLKEALAAGILKVCKLNLSKEGLRAIPKDLYGFSNMKELDLGTTIIDEKEIKQLQDALPNCKIVYQLISAPSTDNNYYFITALKFDAKDYPTSDQLYFLEKLGEYLRNYPSARVGLDLRYSRGMTANRENSMLNLTRNILEKAGASSKQISKMTGKELIQQEQQQQQQQQQPLNANISSQSQDLDKVLIYVSGIDAAARRTLLGYLSPKSGK